MRSIPESFVELQLHQNSRIKASNEFRKFWKKLVETMSAVANSSVILPISSFLAGVDMHWETQRQVVWNEREHTREEHELVYEISWIKELSLWRTFLRSRRRVNN